ncbi:MAG: hypothetical protein KC439_02190 [Yoonia sp.]|nr:hypothetical protein [Yoonia sp.]
MFNFIKSRIGGIKTVAETQRQTIDRALAEVNEVVALMIDKPKVTIDPATGSVTLDLPDQMPDEALALPAPETVAEGDIEGSGEDKAA